MEQLKIPLARCVWITGESMAVIYDAVKAGHLKTFLVGRRRFVRPEALRAWVEFLEAESESGRPVTYRPRTRLDHQVGDASDLQARGAAK